MADQRFTRWRWAIGPSTGSQPTRQLTEAFGRRMTARIDAAFDAQFSIDGRSAEVTGLTRLAWDLWIYLEQSHIFRGRITVDQGRIGANGHSLQLSALDYRGMLKARQVGAAGAYYPPGTDQAVLTWNLISTSQALTGGNWGLTNGLGSAASGQTRELTLDPGKPIVDALGELGRLDNGFEWEVSPALAFNRWYPRRGNDNGLRLDFGGVLSAVDYGFSGDDFGNAGLVTGDQGTTPVTFASATFGTDPRGRWERSQGFSSVKEQSTLDAKGPWYLSQIEQVRPDYRVTFKQREWNPDKQVFTGGWPGVAGCWLGDTVYPSFRSGWVQESGTPHRVVEIQLVPDDEDSETVTAGLLRVPT